MSLYKQAALLVKLTIWCLGRAPVTHLAKPCWCGAGSRCLGRLSQSCFLTSSAVAGEFRPECVGLKSEAQVLWKELVFADSITGGIPAQPSAVAQFCICPVVRGNEVTWIGSVPLSVMESLSPESRDKVGTDCGAWDGEK